MTRTVIGPPERNAILGAIVDQAPRGMEMRHDGTEDPLAAAYVEGVRTAWEAARAILLGERYPLSVEQRTESADAAEERREATERGWLEQTIRDVAAACDQARQVGSAFVPIATVEALLRRPR